MAEKKTATSSEIIDEVIALVKQKIDPAQQATLEQFIRMYYRNTASEDLAEITAADLYGAALAHWNFASQRKSGDRKVRIYNPQFENHGWQSPHTIVEIVHDDMPFLVDSVRMLLNSRNLTTHLVIHPIIRVKRDKDNRIAEVIKNDDEQPQSCAEAFIHVEVDRQTEKTILDSITQELETVLQEVSIAVEDWQPMCSKMHEIIDELKNNPPPLDEHELQQAQAFLEWAAANHFTFLGYREYKLIGTEELRSVSGSGLGLLRNEFPDQSSKSFASLPLEIRRLALEPRLLLITKASRRSSIHRPGYLDHIGIKRFDDKGRVIGERRFMGLYTSAAYNNRPSDIPLLKEKMRAVMTRTGYTRGSHASKALLNIIETFPRDLLFQIEEDELYETCMGIFHLQERQRIRLFIHRDRYGRFYSCLVYVPREVFNTQVRQTIQAILSRSLGGDGSEFNVHLSDSILARLYFVLHAPPDAAREYDIAEIEEELRLATRNWSDDLHDALLESAGEEQGMKLFRRYGDAFKPDYCDSYSVRQAITDIHHMEMLTDDESELAMSLYRPIEAPQSMLRLKLFHLERPIPLSDALPMLENMGLRVEEEQPNKVSRADAHRIWVHDFKMSVHGNRGVDLDQIREKFQDTFARVWRGDIENDGLNRLVLRAGLDWREIVILRAYSRYMHQAGTPFSNEYIERALSFNFTITARLIALFHARFDPSLQADSEQRCKDLTLAIENALEEVISLDEDRILRNFLALIQATLRTNHYQTQATGTPKAYLSFKFDPKKVPDLPEPRPMYEIFVYSPRVEGVHLRGGPVARGGLRWSDRREDFRTEVLGLVKAQMVKNAVIVPVGSKGGFYPKQLPINAEREAIQAEGIACYQTFIRGLLDLTDNLVAGEIAPPQNVVRYDGNDPYLVVAADKGTATFSDIANAISVEYGFWLGDAFASGGSQGYDHKAMGITARGAWESVKRHFRELGLNTQAEPFTVIGIGDMAGDVFGNGMLLSKYIRLVAAFNHIHIFLDPDPDPESSYLERERLFRLPRSSWEDYNRELISRGGGIYSRSAKSIPLSDEVRKLLDTSAAKMTPNELIRSLLTAPVDLLWNGGIGTYIKSKKQHHNDVGDRNNDALRVNADELRCRVIGEGGNLGVTQLGRIEFAAHGGRINTDAIDNSAGVDCSDHEVNIKILLNEVVQNEDMTEKQRNQQLARMTDEVAELVLRDNYLQTQALSIALAQAPAMLEVHSRLIRKMEIDGKLDRHIEYLPDNEEIDARMSSGKGLTAPELSVLMAYAKIILFTQLMDSDLPGEIFFNHLLIEYFPKPLRKKFSELMAQHRLSREIISTVLANEVVNRLGISFVFRLNEESGARSDSIARAYTVAAEVFSMHEIWRDIEELDNLVPAQLQTEMILDSRKLVERAARWFLRNRVHPIDIAENVETFAGSIAPLVELRSGMLNGAHLQTIEKKQQKLVQAGVPENLARKVALFGEQLSALDIIEVSNSLNLPVEPVSRVHFSLGEKLELTWLHEQIIKLPRGDRWQALSRAAMREDLSNQHRNLTRDVLEKTDSDLDAEKRVELWIERNIESIHRSRQLLTELRASGSADFSMLPAAMREIRSMEVKNVSTTGKPAKGSGITKKSRNKPAAKTKAKK